MDSKALARFEAKYVVATEPHPTLGTPCWLWTGALSRGGYAKFYEPTSAGPRNVYGHRWSYERAVGPVPTGLELDHLCRVRRCVNPLHVEPVTHRVNLLRSDTRAATRRRHAAVTHCPKGHPYEGTNLMIARHGGCEHRTCRVCHNARSLLAQQRKRAAHAHAGLSLAL